MLSAGTPQIAAQSLNIVNRPNQLFSFDEFELDGDARQLRRAGVPLKVDALVLRLLGCFVRSPGRLLTKDELVALVWDGKAISENALTVAVGRVRKTLSAGRGLRDMVTTVYGQGYRFELPVCVRDASELRPESEPLALPSEPRCIGREPIVIRLESALHATRTGQGGMIALLGEAGIGKTRVAEVISRSPALAGFISAWGYFRAVADTPPLWPFVGLLRDVLSQMPNAVRSSARFSALLPELALLLPELAAEHGITAASERGAGKHGTFDAVIRSLALAAESHPLLLILEDLQRADETSLELLQYMLAELPRTRVLVVATARQPVMSAAASSLAQLLSHRNCTRVALTPLSQTHVASYIASLFGQVNETLCSSIFDLSQGNPWLLSELVAQLRQSGQLDTAALCPHKLALPLMKQRMSQLSDTSHEVLARAAVLGRRFSLPLLAAACDRDASELMSSLDEALAHATIQRVDDSLTDFSFTHGLLHTALYDAWPPAARRQLHLQVLQVLDRQRTHSPVPIAQLAYHACEAFPLGDLQRTAQYCSDAAEAAAHTGAFADAIRNLRQALRALDLMLDADPSQRLQLMLRQVELVRAHAADEFPALASALLRFVREHAGAVQVAQVSLLLDPVPGLPRSPLLRGALNEALRRLPEHAPDMRAALLARLATHAPCAYAAASSGAQMACALKLTERSSELSEHLSVRFDELYRYAGPAHALRGEQALQDLEAACTQHGAGPLPALMLDLHRAIGALQAGQLSPMQRALMRCAARCHDLDAALAWHVERFHALTRIFCGERTFGRELLRALHDGATRRAIAGTELACAYDQSLLFEGEATDPLALAPDACDPPHIWALKLRALAATGALAEAHSALSLVVPERLAQLPCDREFLGTFGALARAALDLRSEPYARAVYEQLLPYPTYFAAGLVSQCEGSVSLLLGLLARSFGDIQRARQHLTAAISISQDLGLTPCAAEARLALKACD